LATSNISRFSRPSVSNGARVHLLRVSRTLPCARWRKQTEEFEERGKGEEVGEVSERQSGLPRRCIAFEKGSSEISSPSNRPSSLVRFPFLLAASPRRIIARSSLFVTVAGRDDLRDFTGKDRGRVNSAEKSDSFPRNFLREISFGRDLAVHERAFK